MRLLLFENTPRETGYNLIGKENTNRVLSDVLFRQPATFNPFVHLKTILLVLFHLRQSVSIIHECKTNGLSAKQIYGQFLYYHCLLGKQFDLVHINAMQTAYHIKAKAWFGNARVIVSSRGQDFDFDPNKYDLPLQRADHVHVLGQYLKEKVMNKGIEEQHITVIPPAYIPDPAADPKPRTLPSGTIHIATAARLYWTKGFRYALQNIRRLVDDGMNVRYHIYGSGPQKDELHYLVKQYQLNDSVIFHGWTEEPELKKQLQTCSIYLLLSIEEAYNNSALMAQSLGIPCIVSNTGGLPENVIHNHTGLVVPAYDGKSAAEAIKQLLSNPDTYASMSIQAIQRVQGLSINTQTEAYSSMYQHNFS